MSRGLSSSSATSPNRGRRGDRRPNRARQVPLGRSQAGPSTWQAVRPPRCGEDGHSFEPTPAKDSMRRTARARPQRLGVGSVQHAPPGRSHQTPARLRHYRRRRRPAATPARNQPRSAVKHQERTASAAVRRDAQARQAARRHDRALDDRDRTAIRKGLRTTRSPRASVRARFTSPWGMQPQP